jgi:hypothetical protein
MALNPDFEESLDPDRLAKNLELVRLQIDQACQKAQRKPGLDSGAGGEAAFNIKNA